MKTFEIKKVEVSEENAADRRNEPYRNYPKLYVWRRGETLIENLVNRKSRPYDFYKEEVIPEAMDYLKANDPTTYEKIKKGDWRWRQKCGCTCPCSPGFIDVASYGYTVIHVTIEAIEAKAE